MAIATGAWLRQGWAVVGDAFGHFSADDGWAMSSHVALSALMAVFPFVIFVTAMAGFIGQGELAADVASILFQTWPAEIAAPISAEVQRVISQAHVRLLTVSAVVALVLASNGVEAARTALNRAYRVVDRRSFIARMGQNAVFVLAGAVASLALASLVVVGPPLLERIVAFAPALRDYEAGFYVARYTMPGIILVVVLAAAHVWLPAGRPYWLELWPGMVVTLALWLLSAAVFAIYLRRFANLAATYAGLASVFTAVFFLYVVAASLIFGAEFNASLNRLRQGRIG